MERNICIHGHFYQPPRENPWLESVEMQDEAHPFHDWNERITAECYAPNSAARILDDRGWIARIVNNYSRISFNFGPTLLSWMEKHAPDTYAALIAADKESRDRFSGHGSALAQAYNHLIMPLASRRDKRTQVIWGIADFEHRFGRKPEGMWLPETAVDLETLDIMAEQGIRFTILAPHQARRVRPDGDGNWVDVKGGTVSTTRPYTVHLPSGRRLAVFFYNGHISLSVAFEGLLRNGELLASRLMNAFESREAESQLVHIATDGETYGHHHKFGEMALAYTLQRIETSEVVRLTNYGEYLEKHPPTYEAEIVENTSWSCIHGVERWRGDCGCSTGEHPGSKQSWRAPLREAMDWLRDDVLPLFQRRAGDYVRDPWLARNDYICVVLDRSRENVERFLSRHASRPLSEQDKIAVLKLMELQRHAMLMYTSCGWFFDDISNLGSQQIILYAGRVIQLAREQSGSDFEARFLSILEKARSNKSDIGDGSQVYKRLMANSLTDMRRVAAHYAADSLSAANTNPASVFCYTVEPQHRHVVSHKDEDIVVGRARITSNVTWESEDLFYVAMLTRFGFTLSVSLSQGDEGYLRLIEHLSRATGNAQQDDVSDGLRESFGASTYMLEMLFRDKQQELFGAVSDAAATRVLSEYRHLYEKHHALIKSWAERGYQLPETFSTAIRQVVNEQLSEAFASVPPEVRVVKRLLAEAQQWGIELESEKLAPVLSGTLEKMMMRLVGMPGDILLLRHVRSAMEMTRSLPFEVNLWRCQNLYCSIAQTVYPHMEAVSRHDDASSARWVETFKSLGSLLHVRLPA